MSFPLGTAAWEAALVVTHSDEDHISQLSALSFGAPAAERDINVGLIDYFVESEAYQRLVARRKTIVLGNRGSGKSAIFKVFAERERRLGRLVLELRPEEFSYELLAGVLQKQSQGAWAKHSAFASAWKYLISSFP